VDWGLGFITEPAYFNSYCAPGTFGHDAARSLIGFADRRRGLVVAIAMNGIPGSEASNLRGYTVIGAIYEDLELTHR
jgi:hypothetical protein